MKSFFLGLIMLLSIAVRLAAAERQVLSGHVPAAAAHQTPLRPVPATNHLSLAIGLPLRNQELLDTLLGQIDDPLSTNYQHFMTSEEFAQTFGPTEEDYETLKRFAVANGLAVTHTFSNRTLLDVDGSVSDIEKAFHVHLHFYQHPTEPRMFFAPDSVPSLDLALPVLGICGLDNFIIPRPTGRMFPLEENPYPQPQGGSGPGGLFMGSDFRKAYAPGTTLNGSGQIVALVQFGGYFVSDITGYETQAGLPNVPLQNILLDGFNGASNVFSVEVTADIELVIAMAPGLSKVTVYEGISADNILNQIATDNTAKQISASYTFAEDAMTVQAYRQFRMQSQAYFNAAGDGGAFIGSGGAGEPAVDTNVTAVGGTVLSTDQAGNWVSETVWNNNYFAPGGTNGGGNGGFSSTFPIPPYQLGIDMSLNHGSTTFRNVPDVALLAVNAFVVFNGQNSSFAGTSASSPLFAGYCALINQQAAIVGKPPLGFLNGRIYELGKGPFYRTAMHDITTGNNTNNVITTNFFAVAGYDLCTGWGTPAGTNFINALVGAPWFVWVQFGNPSPGNGTYASPYNTLALGTNGVLAGGTVVMEGGSTSEKMRIVKAMTLRSAGGTATVGR